MKKSIKNEIVIYKCLSKKDRMDLNNWRKFPKVNNKNTKKETYLTKLASKTKGLKYKEFLKSEYWSIIRFKVLKRDKYRCKWCNASSNLEIHHKTYKNHGKEHLHMQDLIALCNTCHKQLHDNFKIQ